MNEIIMSSCGSVVTLSEGKLIAVEFKVKYVEVSAILNLRVDELLAGIVKQIRLFDLRKRMRNSKKRAKYFSARSKQRSLASGKHSGCIESAARGIVDKFLKRPSPMFRSCDNLQVL